MVPEIKESIILDKLRTFNVSEVFGEEANTKMSGLERYKKNEEKVYNELTTLWSNASVLSAILFSIFLTCFAFTQDISDTMMIALTATSVVIFGLCRELVRYKKNLACLRWNSTVMSIANGLQESAIISYIDDVIEDDGKAAIDYATKTTQEVIDIVARSTTAELRQEYEIYEDEE